MEDINLEFFETPPRQTNYVENEYNPYILNAFDMKLPKKKSAKIIQMAQSISKVDALVSEINNLKNENIQLQEQLKGLQVAAQEVHELYAKEKEEHCTAKSKLDILQMEYHKIDAQLTNMSMVNGQLKGRLADLEGRPINFDNLVLKYVKIINKLEGHDILKYYTDKDLLEKLRKYCASINLKIPKVSSPNKSRSRVNKLKTEETAVQCNILDENASQTHICAGCMTKPEIEDRYTQCSPKKRDQYSQSISTLEGQCDILDEIKLKNYNCPSCKDKPKVVNQYVQCSTTKHDQSSQYVCTTISRQMNTEKVLQRDIHTMFPELLTVNDILDIYSKWSKIRAISPLSSPDHECSKDGKQPLKKSIPAGTCTMLCNIRRKIDYLPHGNALNIKQETFTPSVSPTPASYHTTSRSRVPSLSSTTTSNINSLISSFSANKNASLEHISTDAFNELWQIFGKMLLSLLQTNNASTANTTQNAPLNQKEFLDWLLELYTNREMQNSSTVQPPTVEQIDFNTLPSPLYFNDASPLSGNVVRPQPHKTAAEENITREDITKDDSSNLIDYYESNSQMFLTNNVLNTCSNESESTNREESQMQITSNASDLLQETDICEFEQDKLQQRKSRKKRNKSTRKTKIKNKVLGQEKEHTMTDFHKNAHRALKSLIKCKDHSKNSTEIRISENFNQLPHVTNEINNVNGTIETAIDFLVLQCGNQTPENNLSESEKLFLKQISNATATNNVSNKFKCAEFLSNKSFNCSSNTGEQILKSKSHNSSKQNESKYRFLFGESDSECYSSELELENFKSNDKLVRKCNEELESDHRFKECHDNFNNGKTIRSTSIAKLVECDQQNLNKKKSTKENLTDSNQFHFDANKQTLNRSSNATMYSFPNTNNNMIENFELSSDEHHVKKDNEYSSKINATESLKISEIPNTDDEKQIFQDPLTENCTKSVTEVANNDATDTNQSFPKRDIESLPYLNIHDTSRQIMLTPNQFVAPLSQLNENNSSNNSLDASQIKISSDQMYNNDFENDFELSSDDESSASEKNLNEKLTSPPRTNEEQKGNYTTEKENGKLESNLKTASEEQKLNNMLHFELHKSKSYKNLNGVRGGSSINNSKKGILQTTENSEKCISNSLFQMEDETLVIGETTHADKRKICNENIPRVSNSYDSCEEQFHLSDSSENSFISSPEMKKRKLNRTTYNIEDKASLEGQTITLLNFAEKQYLQTQNSEENNFHLFESSSNSAEHYPKSQRNSGLNSLIESVNITTDSSLNETLNIDVMNETSKTKNYNENISQVSSLKNLKFLKLKKLPNNRENCVDVNSESETDLVSRGSISNTERYMNLSTDDTLKAKGNRNTVNHKLVEYPNSNNLCQIERLTIPTCASIKKCAQGNKSENYYNDSTYQQNLKDSNNSYQIIKYCLENPKQSSVELVDDIENKLIIDEQPNDITLDEFKNGQLNNSMLTESQESCNNNNMLTKSVKPIAKDLLKNEIEAKPTRGSKRKSDYSADVPFCKRSQRIKEKQIMLSKTINICETPPEVDKDMNHCKNVINSLRIKAPQKEGVERNTLQSEYGSAPNSNLLKNESLRQLGFFKERNTEDFIDGKCIIFTKKKDKENEIIDDNAIEQKVHMPLDTGEPINRTNCESFQAGSKINSAKDKITNEPLENLVDSDSPQSPLPTQMGNENATDTLTIIPLERQPGFMANNKVLKLFDVLINNYKKGNQKKVLQSLTNKENRRNEDIVKKFEEEIKLYCYTEMESDLYCASKRVINGLLSIYHDYNLIQRALILVAQKAEASNVSSNELPSVIQEMPPRHLSKCLQRIFIFLKNIVIRNSNFCQDLIKKIDLILFTSKQAAHFSLRPTLNLTQLYLMASKVLEYLQIAKHPARLFIVKCLYFYMEKSIAMIHEVLIWYPTVLPHREDKTYDRSDALISVIQKILMSIKYEMYNPDLRDKIFLSKLRYEYHFEPFKPTTQEVIYVLVEKLKNSKFYNISFAFALLCKHMGVTQTENIVLNLHLLPLANEYYSLALKTHEYDKNIAVLLEVISVLLKPLPIKSDTEKYFREFARFLNGFERQLVQESALCSLLRLQKFNPEFCYNLLRHFRPTYNLEPHTQAMLKTFLYRRSLIFWNDLRTRNEKNFN